MSRRHAAVKKPILPDAKYGSTVIAKFTNYIMQDGKKSIAERIVYDALEEIQAKAKRDALEVFNEAVEKVKPALEVRSRRVGGATYQIPCEVRAERKLQLALRWLISAARKRGEKTMKERLAGELLDAYNDRGNAIKKREDTHKMAEANKAFSHFRW